MTCISGERCARRRLSLGKFAAQVERLQGLGMGFAIEPVGDARSPAIEPAPAIGRQEENVGQVDRLGASRKRAMA
jgi:hypothetical protein